MKRGLVFPSLLLLVSLTLPACREDETTAQALESVEASPTPVLPRAGASSLGSPSVSTPTSNSGASPIPTSASTDDPGGSTASVSEAVSVISSVVGASSLSVRRTNGETWAFQLAGGISASAGDVVVYVAANEAFGSPRGQIVDANERAYSILSSARLR